MHENLVLDHPVADLDYLQSNFTDMMKRRLQISGDSSSLKVHNDAAFTENPMERKDVEESVKVGSNEL
jgi:hypothetical protein